ncbi:MAG: M43 family zinc metalloprotease [Bacteroidota bacterium]
MMRSLILALMLFFCLGDASGQSTRKCGTDEAHQALMKKHRGIQSILSRKKQEKKPGFPQVPNPVYPEIVIPVVFHIVTHTAQPPFLISKEQVYSQLDALNEYFSQEITMYTPVLPKYWADVYARDTRIRFCLARRDPQGNPTSGITRTTTDVPSFSSTLNNIKFDATGGKDIWPRDLYLNIWVGKIDDLLGYAQYPFGPAETDGIVIDPDGFGTFGTPLPNFSDGKTAVHEVGHWLDLLHPWGPAASCSVDDFIDDTPPQEAPNWLCDPYTFSCDGSRDMRENFMNYSWDPCNTFFTEGQAQAMRFQLRPGGFRYPLTQSDRGCREIPRRMDE